jgi:hypothetical protein
VLATIKFDHDGRVQGGEVGNEGSYGDLPAKVIAGYVASEMSPETPLGIR